MDINDCIPVYSNIGFRLDSTSNILQFSKILEIIKEFGISLTLNQALLLLDYEDKAVYRIGNIYLDISSDKVQSSSEFYINLDLDKQTKENSNQFLISEFEVLQHELRLINEIKQTNKLLTTGGCNKWVKQAWTYWT